MSFLKSTVLALAAAATFTGAVASGPALAQGEGMALRDRQALVVMTDGRTAMRTVSDQATLDAVVQKGKQVNVHSILVMSGGKLYLVEDYRMPNGTMASDHMMSAR